MPELKTYAPGDWVVHRHHGIGKIESTETKNIGDQSNTYCKIRTFNSTIWLPAEKMNEEWLRPLASPSEIYKALDILVSPPRPAPDNINSRKSRVKKVDSNDAPAEIARLLRDLLALKREKNKNLIQAEREALRHFTDCFLAEWSVSADIPIEEAKQEFEELVHNGREE